MNNRNALQNIAEDLVRMEGISRSIVSDNQRVWREGSVLIFSSGPNRIYLASSCSAADRAIKKLIAASR
ncbi:hypothetical protein GZ77_08965 [Endozoicomonas montiporae]|uniref:Uncharacterized protein n=2 Tax=Endozoicomonas montiporae TaxID=1027273 RepID=A0A081N7Q8_9GAMM|nr:hypothetical protein [Endozoicomonas montiporae]AMO55663.1 hypothetical protein EZMO1_1495 [Endozoicomonas montiporae CL-33]KEQ14481.1 hypothetical protein GZ77_08965 [Endozoicomonas montiporae]